jgi:thiamine kinase
VAQGYAGNARGMSPEGINPKDINLGRILAATESFAAARIIEKLAGGPASDSYLIERGVELFVLRIDTDVAVALGLDREAETKILRYVGSHGLGPVAEYSDPHRGVLITRYIEGYAWSESDLNDSVRIRNLAALLRRLHALKPQGHGFDIDEKIDHYARIISSPEGDELAGNARSLSGKLDDKSVPQCVCHNDLNSANIIEGRGLTLIDWEYAAIGDPMFDLATIAEHHRFDQDRSEVLLSAYFDSASEDVIDRYRRYRYLYRHLLVLWLASVERLCGISAEHQIQLQREWGALKSGDR